MFTKRRNLSFHPIEKIASIGFVSGLSLASIGTIWAIYLESLLKNPSYVGYLITFFTIITLVSLILTIPIVERKSKTKLFFISLITYFFSLILFSILSNIYAVIALGIITSIIVSIRMTSFGLIVSDKSRKSNISRNEGIIYTFSNLAWLIGPLIAGFVSAKYGMRAVFIVGTVFMFVAILLFKSLKIVDNRAEKRADKNLIKVMKKLRKHHRVHLRSKICSRKYCLKIIKNKYQA